ncbi:MAG: nucleoside deaminase, partial [Acidimicrobiia bacterium]|nr:nucleoside deaminase [Acidimicrobiia bacterium]
MSRVRALPLTMRWDLPPWAHDFVRPDQRFPTVSERMAVAVELSRLNMVEETGDPFGAAVFDLSTLRPLAVGVNVVAPSATVAAHGE